jgi:hypothetical protein
MANEPLQSRAGKNYLPFLNAFDQTSQAMHKLVSKTTTLLENTDGRRLVVQQFATACGLVNRCTDPVDAELYLEDDEGNRALMASSTIAAGASGSLASIVGMLAQGEKIVLVITSAESILTGSGLWVVPGATILPAPNGDCIRRVVTSTSLVAELPPGRGVIPVGGTSIVTSVSNFSAVPVDVSVYCVTDEGEFLFTSAPVTIPAGEVKALPLVLLQNAKSRLEFTAIPGTGYLQYNQDTIIPVNAFDAEPFAE